MDTTAGSAAAWPASSRSTCASTIAPSTSTSTATTKATKFRTTKRLTATKAAAAGSISSNDSIKRQGAPGAVPSRIQTVVKYWDQHSRRIVSAVPTLRVPNACVSQSISSKKNIVDGIARSAPSSTGTFHDAGDFCGDCAWRFDESSVPIKDQNRYGDSRQCQRKEYPVTDLTIDDAEGHKRQGSKKGNHHHSSGELKM